MNGIAQGKNTTADLKAYIAKDAAACPPEAFRLMFTSNHDENSWAGTEFERMGDAADVMALLTFVLPSGQPLIYTGQEIGYDHRFQFFEKDPVPAWEWNARSDFYKSLTDLRHAHPALAAGEKGGEMEYLAEDGGLLVFVRSVPAEKSLDGKADSVTVAVNLGAAPVSFAFPHHDGGTEYFTGRTYGYGEEVILGPWGYSVF